MGGEKLVKEQIHMTTLVNIKTGAQYTTYIGRKNLYYNEPVDSKWANKYVIGKDGTREEVIEKYRRDLLNNPKLLEDLHEIDGQILGCYCAPDFACHGEVLIELREKQKLEQNNKPKVKLAIIGSRGITNKKKIFDFLDKNISRIEMIISGGCPNSPDEIARQWCEDNGMPILIFYPNWGRDSKKAGFIRNEYIIRACDKVVAFHDGKSKGTLNSLEWAQKLNKPSKVIICD